LAAVLIAAAAIGYAALRGCASGDPDAGGPKGALDSRADARPAPAVSAAPDAGQARADDPDSAAADAAPASAQSGRDAGARRPTSDRKKPGYFSIDSTPYATIYLDGRKLGITPLIRVRVPPGRHRVRAVTEAGDEQRFEIEVEPGKTTPPKQLYW
jgi:serine/threonine-protein kinase